jgi:hypothetical protein
MGPKGPSSCKYTARCVRKQKAARGRSPRAAFLYRQRMCHNRTIYALSFHTAALFALALLTRFFGDIPRVAQFFVVRHSFLFSSTTLAFLVCTMEAHDRKPRRAVEFRSARELPHHWDAFSPRWLHPAHGYPRDRAGLPPFHYHGWFCRVFILDYRPPRYHRPDRIWHYTFIHLIIHHDYP